MAKILVIDDEKPFLEMMTIRLESHGYEVITACDGGEGLEMAKSESPDLILLDIMMPEIDGFDVCTLLKNNKQYSGIPIIMCTAMAQKVDIETSIDVGADAYIAKPIDHDILLNKIEELLEKPSSVGEENEVGLKILMADDERAILEKNAKKVAEQGYTVITAKDGEEAWEKIQSESPDIILLDLSMPKMDGFEVLTELRENPPSEKWQPVIIISSSMEAEDAIKGVKLEAEYYLVKPCSIETILKAIRVMASLIPQRKSSSESEKK